MLKQFRKVLLLLTLAGVVGFAVFAPRLDKPADPALIVPPARSAFSADKPLPALNTARDKPSHKTVNDYPGRDVLGDSSSDLFGQQSRHPSSSKSAAAPQPAPQPPPMTYRFAGRLLQDGQLQVFVSKGDTPVVIKVGETLDGGYVVESLTTDSIRLIYPPLGHRVIIAIPVAMSAAGSEPR